jgi:hypothetical protein
MVEKKIPDSIIADMPPLQPIGSGSEKIKSPPSPHETWADRESVKREEAPNRPR